MSRFLSRKPQYLSFCEFQHLPLLTLTYLSSKYIVGAQQSLFFGAEEEEPLKELCMIGFYFSYVPWRHGNLRSAAPFLLALPP